MDYARMLLPAAMRKKDEDFTIDLAITDSNLTFGVTPYWNAGGWCNILDWGDGQSQAATTSGTALTHTYAEAGSYRVKVRGDMYRFRVGSTNPAAVIDCNGNWDALGNITNGGGMFNGCTNAVFAFKSLPSALTVGTTMFDSCENAILSLTHLPTGLTYCNNMFCHCYAATINLTELPGGLSGGSQMFNTCYGLTVSLDTLVQNNPSNWDGLINLFYFMWGAKVTGSIASFMRKCPNVVTPNNAFTVTNTTTFGDNDYFEITLTTTETNQSWGFTATSSAGRWYCFDWGDGTAITANKNLDVFTSGTKVSHTFATPGTYHIKLATAPCSIVFDPYDSDNGNWAALGLPADGLGGVFVKEGTTTVSSAMTMESATITSGQSQMVYNLGKAFNTAISSGGSVTVSNGGLASGCDMYSSARVFVSSGGSVHGLNHLQTGAVSYIYSGGTATEVSVSAGQLNNNNAYISGVHVVGAGYVQGTGLYEGGTQYAGYAYLNGSANDWTLSGGYISMFSGTPHLTNLIQRGGNCHVRISGAVVSGAVISGGTFYVSSGCTALAVSSAGGTVVVADGGYIEYVNQ